MLFPSFALFALPWSSSFFSIVERVFQINFFRLEAATAAATLPSQSSGPLRLSRLALII
jgi:hypothetical protein